MRRYLLAILLLLPAMSRAEHVFEAGLHGGVAGWSAQPIYVEKQVGLHAGGHIYYSWFSPKIVGLRTGITLDNHNMGFGKSNYEDAYSTIDVENQQMDISYHIGRLKEQYSILSVGVPMQIGFSKKNFTFWLGAKVNFPLQGTWNQTIEDAGLSVYFPDYDNRVDDSYALGASPSFQENTKGKIPLPKVQWWGTLELNYAISLNTWASHYRSYIMIGAYLDYCFTKITPDANDAKSLIMLTDTRDGLPLQRVCTSILEGNRQGHKLVREGTMFDVGVKISYAISPYDPHKDAKHSCNCL